MIQTLFDLGIDINARSGVFRPALEQAANQGHYAAVLLLLENGANPNIYDHKGTSPFDAVNQKAALCKACYGGYEDIVFLLLEPKYGILPRKVTMRTAMLAAVRGGHERLAMSMLDRCTWKTPSYRAVLHGDIFRTAIQYGHISIFQRMLVIDGDPKATVRYNDILTASHRRSINCSRTTVELASAYGRASILSLLLDNGATLTKSCLSLAAHFGHVDVARVLLDHPQRAAQGFDINSMLDGKYPPSKVDSTGVGPLEGTERYKPDSKLLPPLEMASVRGEIAMVKFLLKRCKCYEKVQQKTPERDLIGALTGAVSHNEYEIVSLLLEAGANPNGAAEADPHDKPMFYAGSGRSHAIVKLLKEYGATG